MSIREFFGLCFLMLADPCRHYRSLPLGYCGLWNWMTAANAVSEISVLALMGGLYNAQIVWVAQLKVNAARRQPVGPGFASPLCPSQAVTLGKPQFPFDFSYPSDTLYLAHCFYWIKIMSEEVCQALSIIRKWFSCIHWFDWTEILFCFSVLLIHRRLIVSRAIGMTR